MVELANAATFQTRNVHQSQCDTTQHRQEHAPYGCIHPCHVPGEVAV